MNEHQPDWEVTPELEELLAAAREILNKEVIVIEGEGKAQMDWESNVPTTDK